MDVAVFRTNFPEFSDTAAYPPGQITFYAGLAERQLSQKIWLDTWTFAVNLYVAHEITIAKQNSNAAAVGGTPGVSNGIANSKTVGSVTAAYDSVSQSEKDGGWWNRTTYGMQLYRLIRIFGAGAVQLNSGICWP